MGVGQYCYLTSNYGLNLSFPRKLGADIRHSKLAGPTLFAGLYIESGVYIRWNPAKRHFIWNVVSLSRPRDCRERVERQKPQNKPLPLAKTIKNCEAKQVGTVALQSEQVVATELNSDRPNTCENTLIVWGALRCYQIVVPKKNSPSKAFFCLIVRLQGTEQRSTRRVKHFNIRRLPP